MQDKLKAPVCVQPSSLLGKTFKQSQPDVEILAVITKDTPTSMDAYNRMKGKNDWCSLQLVVLGTSGPGFSSVPYTSTKRKDEREVNPQPLYDIVPHSESYAGMTRLYTYEKGRSNKDKGKRVDVMQDLASCEMVAATGILPSGLCISSFIREDAMTSDFFALEMCDETMLDNDVLQANTLVRAVVATANIDQAQKGMLIKIKRIKAVSPMTDSCIAAAFASKNAFPVDPDAFDNLQSSTKSNFPALSRAVYSGNIKYFHPKLSTRSFAVADEAEKALIIVDPSDNENEISIPAHIALAGTGAATLSRAAKIVSIGLSQNAVQILVRTQRIDDVTLNNGPANCGVLLYVNPGKLIGVEQILDFSVWPHNERMHMWHPVTDNGATPSSAKSSKILWTQPNHSIWVQENGMDISKQLVFEVDLEETHLEAPKFESTDLFLADNAGGAFMPLRIYISDSSMTLEDTKTAIDEGDDQVRMLISLQLRPHNRGTGGGKKRKRAEIVLDEMDF